MPRREQPTKVPTCRRQRLTDRVKPIEGCDGDCLSCAHGIQIPTCGRIALAEARALTFSDYLRLKPDLKLFDLK